jgi:hypothetical protein
MTNALPALIGTAQSTAMPGIAPLWLLKHFTHLLASPDIALPRRLPLKAFRLARRW